MRLGISYIVFDGEEWLQTAMEAIRDHVDFISVIFQKTSYFGQVNEGLEDFVRSLKMIDHIEEHVPDLSKPLKETETMLRNRGNDLSRNHRCSHHISADVDEIYLKDQLQYVKDNFQDFDTSVVYLSNFLKHPNWKITPSQNHVTSFIQKVSVGYDQQAKSLYPIDVSRRPRNLGKCRLFGKEEFEIYHMSYVRKNIRRKVENSSNREFYNVNKFVQDFGNYQLGDRIQFPPDMATRKTEFFHHNFNWR